MENTYTFTARSAQEPAHVATFTLHDGHMAVDIGASLPEVEKLLRNGDDSGEGAMDLAEAGASWLKPGAAWLVQRILRPFSVADVKAEAAGASLQVKAWIRARERRLVPITLEWDQVDNPEASQAFADEVHERQVSTSRPGKYPGPLDYWVTWLAGTAAAGLFLLAAMRRLGGQQGANV